MSPILSMFYGIVVRMYYEKNSQHNLPHIHAKYQDHEVVLALNGEIIEGGLPKGKMKLLDAWVEIHRDELEANWEVYHSDGTYFKIKPLE